MRFNINDYSHGSSTSRSRKMPSGRRLLSLAATACMLLATTFCSANTILGTIKPGTAANQVDVYYKADFTNSTARFTTINICVSIPDQGANNPTSVTITSPLNGQVYTADVQGGLYNGRRYWSWSANPNPNTSATINAFTANTEFLAATITFSGGRGSAPIELDDLQNSTGGVGTFGNCQFYMDMSGLGAVTNDPTLGGTLFYASSGASSTGSRTNSGQSDPYVGTLVTVVLPVKLTAFTAVAHNCDAALSWTTGTEKDFDHFDVQRSADGKEYTTLAAVNSRHMVTGSSYDYTDQAALPAGHYRLKMVDLSGDYTYSNTVMVRTDCYHAGTGWDAYPNPLQQGGNVQVRLDNGRGIDQVRLVVTDLPGRMVLQHTYAATDGTNIFTVPVSSLLPGVYNISMYDQQGRPVGTAHKLIVR